MVDIRESWKNLNEFLDKNQIFWIIQGIIFIIWPFLIFALIVDPSEQKTQSIIEAFLLILILQGILIPVPYFTKGFPFASNAISLFVLLFWAEAIIIWQFSISGWDNALRIFGFIWFHICYLVPFKSYREAKKNGYTFIKVKNKY